MTQVQQVGDVELKKIVAAGGAAVHIVKVLVNKGGLFPALIAKAPLLLQLGDVKWPQVFPEASDLDAVEVKDLVDTFFKAAA